MPLTPREQLNKYKEEWKDHMPELTEILYNWAVEDDKIRKNNDDFEERIRLHKISHSELINNLNTARKNMKK